jgi:hypothetical protein
MWWLAGIVFGGAMLYELGLLTLAVRIAAAAFGVLYLIALFKNGGSMFKTPDGRRRYIKPGGPYRRYR